MAQKKKAQYMLGLQVSATTPGSTQIQFKIIKKLKQGCGATPQATLAHFQFLILFLSTVGFLVMCSFLFFLSSFLSLLPVYVMKYMCVQMHVYMCELACGSQRWRSGVICSLSIMCFSYDLSLRLELTDGQTDQPQVPRLCPQPCLQGQDYRNVKSCLALTLALDS